MFGDELSEKRNLLDLSEKLEEEVIRQDDSSEMDSVVNDKGLEGRD